MWSITCEIALMTSFLMSDSLSIYFQAPLAFENEDDGVEEAGGLEEKEENEEVKNSIDAEEAKAKKEEEKAREELKGIESQNNNDKVFIFFSYMNRMEVVYVSTRL